MGPQVDEVARAPSKRGGLGSLVPESMHRLAFRLPQYWDTPMIPTTEPW